MSSADRNPRSIEGNVRAILTGRLGLITTQEARCAGMSPAAIARRVEAGRWIRVLPTVYRDVMVPTSAEQAAFGAALWAGDDSFVSHASAGVLWGLDGVVTKRVGLWVPPTRRLSSDHVQVHRGVIDPIDRRMIGPIPVTSVPRTLIDLAGELDGEALHAAVEDSIHRGLTTPMSIERRLEALGGKGRPGSRRLREILLDRGASGPAASKLEVKIWRTLRAAGMRPVRQHPVKVGATTYRIDAAFPQWRLGVEGMGDGFHHTQLHRRRDHKRLADLASLSWRIIPVTWDDINADADAVVERVLRALAAAA